jgi:hypothetical protein
MKNPFQGDMNWKIITDSVIATIMIGLLAWKANSWVKFLSDINWSSFFNLRTLIIILLILIGILFLIWIARKLMSGGKSTSINPLTGQPPAGKSSIDWKGRLWTFVRIIVALAALYIVYELATFFIDKYKKDKAAETEFYRPVVDTIALTREWSDWINPRDTVGARDVAIQSVTIGEVGLKMMDADGKVYYYKPNARNDREVSANADSVRYKLTDCDSALLVLTYRRLSR